MARKSSVVNLGSKMMTLALGDKKKGRRKSHGQSENPWQGFVHNRLTSSSKFNVKIAENMRLLNSSLHLSQAASS